MAKTSQPHGKRRDEERARILRKAETGRLTVAEARYLLSSNPKRERHKYGAKRVVVDGIKFPSQLEANRYQHLKLLQRAGKIRKLARQPRFPLIVDGFEVGTYVADFSYEELWRGPVTKVVEDAKGLVLPLYAFKLKMFRVLYPELDFREIRK